jgi:glycosyltransferase involved in cell wall biosynthesis
MHIIESLALGGGAESLLLTLSRNINRARFNLIFCCLSRGGYIAERLKDEGFKVVCLQNYRIRHFYKRIRDIIRLIESENIHIVQTHLVEANLWGRIGAIFSHKPLICKTEHGILRLLWGNRTSKQRAYSTLDKILDMFSNRIIYVSEGQRNIINRGRNNRHKHVVIHNGVDEERFSINKAREYVRTIYGFSDKDIVIGAVGRLVPHKGHSYIFNAVKEVKKKHKRVKILLVGQGPEEETLKELGRTLELDALFLSGEKNDIPELMKSMDIFVHPAFNESFGITIVEAMFSGLPVVATNFGGIPEIVTNGETGILVPRKDSGAIKNALLRLIENPELAKNMGEKGREVAASKFSGQRYARDMEKLYTSLMEGRRR